MTSLNLTPPPIRGSFDSTATPFVVVAQSTKDGSVYLLCEVNYEVDGKATSNESEAIFIPSFTGNINLPYSSEQTGLEYFMPGYDLQAGKMISGNDVNKLPYIYPVTNMANIINYVLPLKCIWSGNTLYKLDDEGTTIPLTLNIPKNQDSYVAKVLINTGTETTFTIDTTNKFFSDQKLLYAGYSYTLKAFGQSIFPFRNFAAATTINQRITNYNQENSYPQFYKQISSSANFLFLNQVDEIKNSDQDFYIPRFPGLDPNSSDTTNAHNFDLKDIKIYFLPNNYYPINYNESSLSFGRCTSINPGANVPPNPILNRLYFAWASGYPSPNAGLQGPIVSCAPGFLDSGPNSALNLCGWTDVQECNRGYFYNYCDSGTFCGQCYGPCADPENPFCDVNLSYTQQLHFGGRAFLCGVSDKPITGINWPSIIGLGVGGLILFFLIIMVLVFSLRGKSNPRDEMINT
jgi:hypothetical protein